MEYEDNELFQAQNRREILLLLSPCDSSITVGLSTMLCYEMAGCLHAEFARGLDCQPLFEISDVMLVNGLSAGLIGVRVHVGHRNGVYCFWCCWCLVFIIICCFTNISNIILVIFNNCN